MPRRLATTLPLACVVALTACNKEQPSEPAIKAASSSPPSASVVPKPPPRAALPPLNVLLISVDALRADGPWLGYPRNTAPNITRFSKQSVMYSHAYALSSYTSMSLGGLMAGRYPSELPRDGRATSSFLPEADFIAEHIKQAGLFSIGVHGHVYFLGDTGINQGFDAWKVFPRIVLNPAREGAVVDPKLADMLMEELGAHAKEKPDQRFFAWVHFMDPHFSYVRHPEQEPFKGNPYADGVEPIPPGTKLSDVGQGLRNQYDGEVLHTDAQIGRLLDYVDNQPWGKHTAVVLTADHGEAFGEHKSYFEHGFLLYDVTTRVPLMLRVPGVKARRIDTRRSHVDVAPTLLELMGVPTPEGLHGTSLVPELKGETAPPQRDIVIDMPYTDQSPRRRALIHGDLKLIVTETDRQPLLFDLAKDPGEQQDLAGDEARLAPMVKLYERLQQATPDFAAPRISKRQY
ncbi:MAG: sulfatase [Polyangiaceae bacterium]|nr:sulfatase [Polyangiaceae bacterium]